jgi:RNA polymerase sigma-70 factor (ECF subfamily)
MQDRADPRSDDDLVEATARGDAGAFEVLVRRHQERAWRLARAMVADARQAEDIVQSAFLKVYEHSPRYRGAGRFPGYLRCIVARLCLDLLDQPPRPAPLEPETHPDPAADPARRVEENERDLAIAGALSLLPPSQRLAIVLKYFEGLSTQAMAEEMETSARSVEGLLARAREKLAVLLARWMT